MKRILHKNLLRDGACLSQILPGLVAAVSMIAVAAPGAEVPLVVDQDARAVIVLPHTASPLLHYAADELNKHIELLSGVRLPVEKTTDTALTHSNRISIFVGGVSENKFTALFDATNKLTATGLKPEGFVLRTANFNGHPAVFIAGADDKGTLYGCYEVLERLGCTFRLTGTIAPTGLKNLVIPELELKLEPCMSRRGFLHPVNFDNASAFSWPDYEKLLDQMARMKCNYLQFWWFSYAPWVQFSYKGEPAMFGDVSDKESGYQSWKYGGFGSRTVDDVLIGKEHFQTQPRMAPLEMQQLQTPEEAYQVSTNLLKRLIAHASKRGIKVWLAVEMASVPPNLGRHGEIVAESPFNYLFGTFLHPLDPVHREIQLERIKALANTYPDAEGIFLNFAELYPELRTQEHRVFFEQKAPEFYRLRELALPWMIALASIYDVGVGLLIDSNIGYFDLFEYLLRQSAEVAPQARIGLMTVGRGYALPMFHKLLPESVPFASLESKGVWTMMGTPMHYFSSMGSRERIIQPRVDDDFDMLGMQFSVRQYAEQERLFSEGVKHGLTGFAGQVERARGTEFNSSFLAQAAWNPALSTEEFYRASAHRIFGKGAAEEVFQGLMRLEENQTHLGYYGFDGGYGVLPCCGPVREVRAAFRFWRQKNPFGGPTVGTWTNLIRGSAEFISRREGAIAMLNDALIHFEQASKTVSPHGKDELAYLMNRTASFRDTFAGLNKIRQGYLNFDDAFRVREKGEAGQEQFVAQLEASLAMVREGNAMLVEATRKFSEIIDHVSDLAVLYHMNARLLLGMQYSLQVVENVVNYHRGRPYLTTVPFERLFPMRPDRGSDE